MSIHHRHPLHEGTEAAAIARLRRSLIRLQDETRLLRRDLLSRKYDPSQPRIPAGSSGGGQWTSGAGGGSGGRTVWTPGGRMPRTQLGFSGYRRDDNGSNARRVLGLTFAYPVSRQWKGHWKGG